jgi:RNA-dependent RNA polymerase
MEIDIKSIHFGADVYDVCKAVELVLHSSDLYDPNDPKNKGRKPNFEVELGESPAGRIHNGTGVLRIPVRVGNQLLEWLRASDENKIILKGRTLRLSRTPRRVSQLVKQRLDKAIYVGPEKEKQRKSIEIQAREARLRLARVQFGMWHRPPNSPPNQRRAFSIEYERDFLSKSEAYIYVVYEHKLIRIDVSSTPLVQAPPTRYSIQIGQRETEEINYMILIKFTTICKFGVGRDEFGQSCKCSRYRYFW